MTREEKLIKSKLGLLELGEYPQNLKSRQVGAFGGFLCRLHGINPYIHFVDVLQRISITKAADVADLTPTRWKELFAHQTLMSDLERQ